jgi:hypothetical protein
MLKLPKSFKLIKFCSFSCKNSLVVWCFDAIKQHDMLVVVAFWWVCKKSVLYLIFLSNGITAFMSRHSSHTLFRTTKKVSDKLMTLIQKNYYKTQVKLVFSWLKKDQPKF